MYTLYLLRYNNYYNRIVRKESSLSAYLSYLVKADGSDTDSNGKTATLTNVNFVENDYVNTEQIVNWGGDLPDYVVVVNDRGTIDSRWFVVESKKIRQGQLKLSLHRDLVVDYYDEAMNAPCFVEKGMLPGNNNLIFNTEQMTYNQIKKSETILCDQSEIPWICLYAARTTGGSSSSDTTEFDLTTIAQNLNVVRKFATQSEFTQWDIYKASQNNTAARSKVEVTALEIYQRVYWATSTLGWVNNYFEYSYPIFHITRSGTTGGGNWSDSADGRTPWFNVNVGTNPSDEQLAAARKTAAQVNAAFRPCWTTSYDSMCEILASYISEGDGTLYDEIMDYNGQLVQVGEGSSVKFYKVQASSVTTQSRKYSSTNSSAPNLSTIFQTCFTTLGESNVSKSWPDIYFNVDSVYVSIQDVTSQFKAQSVNIQKGRHHLTDAPYDMFVLPYPVNGKTVRLTNSQISGWTTVTANADVAAKFANQLIAKYAGNSGTIYDAQILPYCPFPNSKISKSGSTITFDLNDPAAESYTKIVEDSTTTVGYIYHATVSSFSRAIKLENPIVISDYKVESECDIYRLVSPNYCGAFEFTAARNGGINTINIQCTYKPFNPYIKVFPAWGRLYGEDFGVGDYDARGLICGGDFGMPLINSAWETYQRQNVNYQASFDRQIQNLEITQRIQREQERWSIAAGALGAGFAGGAAGAMITPWAGLAGIGTGLASLIAGLRDYELSNQLRAETLDYTKDMFGYALGNIKALPMSLARTSGYTVDNKYFPFLEYYTCSDEEKQALQDKIKYNGMTIMVIGKLADYASSSFDHTYVKGKLIRLEDFPEDYHLAEALAEEINKGVFI